MSVLIVTDENPIFCDRCNSVPTEVGTVNFKALKSGDIQTPTLERIYSHAPDGTGMSWKYDHKIDIDGFILKITKDGESPLIIHQAYNPNARATDFYHQTQLQDGREYVFTLHARKGDVLSKPLVQPIIPQFKKFGDPSYNKVHFIRNTDYGIDRPTGGMTDKGMTDKEWAYHYPILKECVKELLEEYGPRASNIDVKVTALYRSGVAQKLPEWWEIRFDPTVLDYDSQEERSRKKALLKHELDHIWVCPKNWSTDANSNYITKYSGFEESRAMRTDRNSKVRLHPYGHVYDYMNLPSIRNNQFFVFGNGVFAIPAYETGAETMEKLEVEYPCIMRKTMGAIYNRFNSGVKNIGVGKDFIESVWIDDLGIETVEGIPIRVWLEQQEILYCDVDAGPRLMAEVIYYFDAGHKETIVELKIRAFEVFENGSGWYDSGKRYNSNGIPIKINIEGEEILTQITTGSGDTDIQNEIGAVRIAISNKNKGESVRLDTDPNTPEFFTNYSKIYLGSDKIKSLQVGIEGNGIDLNIPLVVGLLDRSVTAYVVTSLPVSKGHENFESVNGVVTYTGGDGIIQIGNVKRNFKRFDRPYFFVVDEGLSYGELVDTDGSAEPGPSTEAKDESPTIPIKKVVLYLEQFKGDVIQAIDSLINKIKEHND